MVQLEDGSERSLGGAETALVAALEAQSEHPLARAIVEGASARGIVLPEVESFMKGQRSFDF